MANMAGQSWSLSKASEALVRNLRTNSMVTRSSDPEMNIGSTSKPRELFGENDRNIGEDSTHSSSVRQLKKEKEEEEDDVEEKVYQGRRLPMRGRRLTFLFAIECLVFFSGMGLLIASLVVHRLHSFEIWGVLIWKWCLIVIIILCGRLLTGWIIQILAYLIENNFILKNKFLYYVYGLKTSIQVCIWMPLFLLTWFLLFDRAFARSSPKTIRVLIYVWRTIAAGLVVVVIEEVKTLLLRKLASTFHANFYFERIQESIFHQYILQRLSGPSLMEIKKDGEIKTLRMLKFKKAEEGKKGSVEKGVIDVEKLQKIEQENVSAWTMNGLVNAITSGLSTTTKLPVKADMNVDTEENSISDYNYGKTTERSDLMDVTINSEFDARLVANSIFGNCAKPGSKSIDRQDFLRFMTGEEAESVFPQFEGGLENGKITKTAFSNWVVKLYLERKSLAHVLNDTKMNMKYLNKIGAGFVLFAIPVIWLLLMGFPAAQVAIFLSSLLIPMIFVFGSTFKTLLESVIFVFVTHPFAVGDRCVVDGEQVVVVEMNILTTIFLTSCNEKVYYPNATLAVKPIKNLYRSPDMGDVVEFSIDASTSMETIGALKSMIVKYIESKPRYWHPKHTVEVKEIENINKLKMVLHIMHTMNHHNMGEKITRRSELLLELKIIFETLGIKYSLPPQEVNVVSYVSAAQPGLT